MRKLIANVLWHLMLAVLIVPLAYIAHVVWSMAQAVTLRSEVGEALREGIHHSWNS